LRPNRPAVVIDEETSDPEHGSLPGERSVGSLLDYGLIALDKPRGPTSHEVVAWVRKMIGTEKAGHSGTLDPPVSGVLPIGLGEATKALGLLLLFLTGAGPLLAWRDSSCFSRRSTAE
jgi:H/ACA ribonucleoprotein complex subunit 4